MGWIYRYIYSDSDSPLVRLKYCEELQLSWWNQWKIQCFDSLLPTKSWTAAKRNVKSGDVVLISYEEKSKAGSFKLGVVESVETDDDGLVRTCIVRYRLVRSDLPKEELKLYFKGLKFKKIRVPIQRLCIILPIEEQDYSDSKKFLQDSVAQTNKFLNEANFVTNRCSKRGKVKKERKSNSSVTLLHYSWNVFNSLLDEHSREE